jgi:uncharacterized membrane protein YdbT with pleckstrin-like domain
MGPELHLVKDAVAPPAAPVASFTHDGRLPSLVAKVSAAVLVAAGLAAWLAPVEPGTRWVLGALAVLAAAAAVSQVAAALGRRGSRYTLTAQRLELERGLFAKRHESVDLWRVRDVVLDQSMFDRLRGAGTITVFSNDQVAPVLTIGPVADAKAIYEKIRDTAQTARRDGRVVTLQP